MFCYYPQLLCLLGFVGILGVVADSHRTLLRQGTKKNEEKPDDAYSIELSLFEKASTEELVRFLDRELQTTIDSLSPPPTSAPTEMEGVCDAVSTSPFSQSLLFDFEGPIGLVTPADIVALEQVLLDAYNAVAMCDTPGAFISADSVDIDIDTADSIGDNIDTGSSALLNYTWLVTFSGNCRGCQSNPGGVETMPACSCDLPTTEALVLECNSRLQTFSSYRLTLLRATVLVPPTAATPAPRTNFTTSIAVSGRGGLFEDFSATLWQILFVETYNFLNFWNFALCDSNARIITSVIPENPVQDPNDSSLFSIVFTIQGSCSGCGSQSIIFGSHSATPQETGTTCPAGASFRCPTNNEFEEALQTTIDQMSGAQDVTTVVTQVEQKDGLTAFPTLGPTFVPTQKAIPTAMPTVGGEMLSFGEGFDCANSTVKGTFQLNGGSAFPYPQLIPFNTSDPESQCFIRMTPDTASPFASSAFLPFQFEESNPDKSFSMTIGYRMFGSAAGAGDGMAFVMHQDTRGVNALGGAGSSLGVYSPNPIFPALIIEWDTCKL